MVFFLLTLAGAASPPPIFSSEGPLIAFTRLLPFFLKPPRLEFLKKPTPSLTWALPLPARIPIGLTLAGFLASTTPNPDGGYDAAAIWNVRARFLAGGPSSWHYAVSDETGTNHPGYPLLVSGFIARTWVIVRDSPSSTPAELAAIFALIAIATLTGGV